MGRGCILELIVAIAHFSDRIRFWHPAIMYYVYRVRCIHEELKAAFIRAILYYMCGCQDYAWVPRLCLDTRIMPGYQDYAWIPGLCLDTRIMPGYQDYAWIPGLCLDARIMPGYQDYAWIPGLCLDTRIMPGYQDYAWMPGLCLDTTSTACTQ